MAKSKPTKKQSSKVLSRQKHKRRQWVTFLRMCRYGVNNFTRNAWLTVAATAVMTITLFVVFVSAVSHNILSNTVTGLRDQVNMSIYLKTDTLEVNAQSVVAEVEKLSSVETVTLRSPEDARDDFIESNRANNDTLEAVKEATNMFPWTVSIKVDDINNTDELTALVNNNEIVKKYLDENREPSFAGSRRDAIQKIAGAGDFAQKLGIAASALFAGISMLIIFNTIRMAIFNRREEIQMMKLIGAERSFIRGPFLVEAIVYGFFAAILSTAIGITLLYIITPSLAESGISAQATLDYVIQYSGFVLLAMIVLGAFIGIISSLLATRRYLKI